MSKSLDTQVMGFYHSLEEAKGGKKRNPEAENSIINQQGTQQRNNFREAHGKEGGHLGRLMLTTAKNKGEGSLGIKVFYF